MEGIKPEKIQTNWVKDICVDIKKRLEIENLKFKNKEFPESIGKPALCCSDIIESIFGKFKMKINQSIGGIYSSVLSIVLFCTPLTTDLIKEILTRTKISDVNKWFTQMAGRSNLSKRKQAFANKRKKQKEKQKEKKVKKYKHKRCRKKTAHF